MLSNTGFFKIDKIEQSEGKYSANIQLNKAHEIYNGHFPNQPVTPGVCMLEMTKEIYELQKEMSFSISKIKTIKFLAVLNPLEQNVVELLIQEMKEEEDDIEIKAELKDTEKTYFKFRGRFQKR